MLEWSRQIGVRMTGWVGDKYNSVCVPPPKAYTAMPILIIWENRAYKTHEVETFYDGCVILPPRFIRDLFIKRMRQAIKHGDEDLFGPDGMYWDREETVSDAERIADEIGNDVLFTFSWRDENDTFQEKVGLINLQDVAHANGQVLFQALREAKAHFKKS